MPGFKVKAWGAAIISGTNRDCIWRRYTLAVSEGDLSLLTEATSDGSNRSLTEALTNGYCWCTAEVAVGDMVYICRPQTASGGRCSLLAVAWVTQLSASTCLEENYCCCLAKMGVVGMVSSFWQQTAPAGNCRFFAGVLVCRQVLFILPVCRSWYFNRCCCWKEP